MNLTLLFSAIVLLCCSFSFADEAKSEPAQTLYHVVSFKFKDSATKEQITEVENAFVALKTKIPEVATLHWGTNVSPENRSKGFTHCFVVTFASEKDRDTYLVHPDHKAFVALVGPVIDDVMVIDFLAKP